MRLRLFTFCLLLAVIVAPGTGFAQLSMKRNATPLGDQLPAQQTTLEQQTPAYKKTLYERLHEMFSKSTEGGDPTKTLRAPFIKAADLKTPTADAMGLPYDASGGLNTNVDLTEPHRDEDQVGDWLNDKISEILNTSGTGWQDHVKEVTPDMNKETLQAYVKYMTSDTQMVSTLTANNMQLHAFVEQKPLLLNKGVVDGRFRWLYEVAATLSMMPIGIKDYSEIDAYKNGSDRVLIRVQIGRRKNPDAAGDASAATDNDPSLDDNGNNDAGLILESWNVRKNTYFQP